VALRLSQPNGDELRFHVNAAGMASQGGAVMDLRPDHQHYDVLVEVQGQGQAAMVGKGSLSCRWVAGWAGLGEQLACLGTEMTR
jgi:hypothetical protein